MAAESDGFDFALACARVAHADKCEHVVVMDLRGRAGFTNFFVVCSGTSERQMRTVADHLVEHGRKVDEPAFRVSGYEAANWILVDFINVVVHVFTPEHRDYYDLELLWGDAPRLDWQTPAPAQPTSN